MVFYWLVLLGCRSECEVFDWFLEVVWCGESCALVLRGEVGVGKMVLLGYVVKRVLGFCALRVGGMQLEMEIAFVGLY